VHEGTPPPPVLAGADVYGAHRTPAAATLAKWAHKGETTYEHVHLLIQPIVEEEVVAHSDSYEQQRVARGRRHRTSAEGRSTRGVHTRVVRMSYACRCQPSCQHRPPYFTSTVRGLPHMTWSTRAATRTRTKARGSRASGGLTMRLHGMPWPVIKIAYLGCGWGTHCQRARGPRGFPATPHHHFLATARGMP
jgi:hypothetical protein